MEKYEIIIKDKDGKEVSVDMISKSFSKDDITIISPIGKLGDLDIKQLGLIANKFNDFGLENFIIWPIPDKDHEVKIKKIKVE